tara:strand:+ start:4378 stop:4809 length:432 start_codon:yes stop_codon:yes gene_type:complete
MEYVTVKYPENKESVQGLMTDQETIKSLQNDLRVARDDQKRLTTRLEEYSSRLEESREKNLNYDVIADYYKKLIIDVVNEDDAIDLDELEEKINRRFDINEYQADVDYIIREFITYDSDFDNIVSDKVNEALKNCRIVVGGEK